MTTHIRTLAAGAALSLLLAPALAAQEPAGVAAARAWRDAHGSEILASFADLLRLPNVASDAEGIAANVAFLRRELERRGVKVELWQVGDSPPVVYGELDTPGATRTLGVYLHYDGQPVDAARWTTPGPWQPTLYTAALAEGGVARPLPGPGESIDPEWRLYARSAGDDKVPFAAITAALDALAAADVPRTANLRFLFEGEEEAGSTHLGEILLEHADTLATIDGWLICDGPVHQSRRPQLVFGVRGVTGFELTTYGATRYLHSGHYGNWAPNPAMELAQLLASMKDDAGNVTIAGFYDTAETPGEEERRALAALPPVDDELRRELGIGWTEGTPPGAAEASPAAGQGVAGPLGTGASLADRLLLPSLNVRGVESGRVGAEARNVIPTTATASVDVRLVQGEDPAAMLDLVEAHLRRRGYTVLDHEPTAAERAAHPRIVRLTREEGYPAARTRMDDPFARWVTAATDAATDEELVLLPTLGGSLPLYLFNDVLGRPLVVVPIANHDNGQHGPDENLRLANLWYGIDLMASLFSAP